MPRKSVSVLSLIIFSGLLLLSYAGLAESQTQKPKITPICKQCHAPDDKILRGTLGGVSGKAGTIQVQVGPAAWLVKFDDETKLVGAEKFSKIPKEKEIAIAFTEKEGSLYAISVSVKPPAKVAEDKLIKTEDVAKLVEMGSEKGNFVLVDSRPGPRYHEGHIPESILIYDADFDKNTEKLPKEKDKLLIFYCGGVT